jgi:hypothetical protein
MRALSKAFASAAVAAALLFSSTAAVAASAAAVPAQSPWTTLSMLNPAGATALGAAAVAAQPSDEGYGSRGGFHPPVAVLAVFLGVIALDIWILLDKHHGHGHIDVDVNRPVSPD